MSSFTVRSNIPALRAAIAEKRAMLHIVMRDAMLTAGLAVQQQLSDASPKGKGEQGVPIAGDAAGPLSDSYRVMDSDSPLKMTIITIQPTKMRYVTKGTGIYLTGNRIYPVSARALFWPGADHPVRSIAGMRPNDFVTPVTSQGLQDITNAVKQSVRDLFSNMGV